MSSVNSKDHTLRVIAKARRVVDDATKAGAHMVKREAKENVKKGPKIVEGTMIPGAGIIASGELRDSFHVRKLGPRTWQVSNDANHAVYVERGTKRMAARPFMNPAVIVVRSKMKGVMSTSWAKVFRGDENLGGAGQFGPGRYEDL